LKTPKNHKNLADFIKKIEQTKYFIASFTKDPTPSRTPYASHRRESYPSCPAYIERSYNLQPFRRRNNKAHNIRFPSYIYRKDTDSKDKGINRTSQSKLWEAGRNVNKDVRAYTIYSDDEDSHVSQPSSPTRS